ncbi:pyridine nucleotide-disulfide oxidoreductase domain protein [Richelia sinica FACHB-800]|uniref:Sulfide-quinone reductase n=1 Tax=Richelia sinica FACHB-800 TaxID=1357546 RepID=A0A975T8C9_9NOST|nr:FAD-dependent oxidoreductase [Richelia sinica]MBD2666305.1 FAD-dependent oxidoreductase [Richelia sinica FACHB-800]QXE23919.1 pyridine nucleotide-disulfide oxidoreductase domain protein [Richelia sinica FACHB-800]
MARIIVIGAGIGGLPTSYEMRRILPPEHQITLISNTPKFTFIPSLPWVGLGLKSLEHIQLDVEKLVKNRGIEWVLGGVSQILPESKQVIVGERVISYDYAVIATGAELALDAVPGLQEEVGYVQSVCNPAHALKAATAWQKFLQNPGPLVVGAIPGAGCFGPAYEFALLADWLLRRYGLRNQVPITFVTPEPYVGHLGISGMANSAELVKKLLYQREIEVFENAAISQIESDKILLADGCTLPYAYAMLLPPFRGARFLREAPDLSDKKGFLPVLPTYQHPQFPSIYSVGVTTQLKPPEITPIPIGVPKTGQMTEAMGMAVAHNIGVELGVISAPLVTPTLEALCLADFGDTGIAFLADQVLPNPITGKRRRAVAMEGRWVSWSKTVFEKFFLTKMRCGVAVPWFEHWGLEVLGLSLVQPLSKI